MIDATVRVVTCGFAWSRERGLRLAHFCMKRAEKDKLDGKLEVRRDYVCLPSEFHDLDSLAKVLETPLTEVTDGSTVPSSDVADQRPLQKLLSASLHSSGSAFIFSNPPPQKKEHPERRSDGSRSHISRSTGGLCVRVVRIEEAQAHLGDDVALATLLANGPLPILVGPLLHKPFFGRKWDSAKQSDHWLASDGARVVSLEISGASASAVARTRLRFDDLRIISPGLLPSLKILHDLLEEIGREDSQAADPSATRDNA